MKTTLTTLTTLVFSLLAGTISQAAIITSPTDLNLGDQYRLAFVTSGTLPAIFSDIDVYNDFVQLAADAVPQLASLGATWSAIGSTGGVDARDNTGTNPNVSFGVPIYLLNDTRLVDNNGDLWDGTIDIPFSVTETGTTLAAGTLVNTGTDLDGTSTGVPHNLDDLEPLFGSTGGVGIDWVSLSWVPEEFLVPLPMYAVSTILTAVPEPNSFLLATLAGLLGLSATPRRRRKC